ncbi:MAG TPA: tetratricopeptide repeat protein [Gemmatimonadaceae bacterium]|nr:tetratricopeptide repeat protein [Gemmatimonadaceae bacterium]
MSFVSLRRIALPAVPVLVALTTACAGRTARTHESLAYGAVEPTVLEANSKCAELEPGAQRLKACRTALGRNANDVAAHEGVAMSLFALGKSEEALATFERALQLNDTSFRTQYGAGMALSRLGRHSEALAHFQRAAELRPEDALSRIRVGTALHSLGRTEEALVAFREGARRDPNNLSAWSNMAVCASELHRPAEAVSYWQRILYIDLTYFDKQVGMTEREMFEASLRTAGIQEAAKVETLTLRHAGQTR